MPTESRMRVPVIGLAAASAGLIGNAFVSASTSSVTSATALRSSTAAQRGQSAFSSMPAVMSAAAATAACGHFANSKKMRQASQMRAAKGYVEDEEAPPPPPFEPSKQVGAMAPLGFFDPAGFSKQGDELGFRNLRAAELKHGRVAMLASFGAVAQHYIRFPGFDSVPAGFGAATTAPGSFGFAALFLLSGVLETAVWTQDPNAEVGDFGDPFGVGMYDEDMRNKEINNGRFAMFAALGIIAADVATGKDAMQQFGLDVAKTVVTASA